MIVTPERFDAALDFDAYLTTVVANSTLWRSVHRTAHVSDEAVARAREVPGRLKLLALTEDWCGDAVNSLPIIARLVDQVPTMELRLLSRDANPDLMDSHLSGASQSIPVVMIFEEEMTELGWWGPRPTALQAWFLSEGIRLEKGERYKQMRTWYARDRGRSILDEVLGIAENGLRISGASR
ncbi:MAG: thioredoxin family protein [Gemmatimonadota bacterium]